MREAGHELVVAGGVATLCQIITELITELIGEGLPALLGARLVLAQTSLEPSDAFELPQDEAS